MINFAAPSVTYTSRIECQVTRSMQKWVTCINRRKQLVHCL